MPSAQTAGEVKETDYPNAPSVVNIAFEFMGFGTHGSAMLYARYMENVSLHFNGEKSRQEGVGKVEIRDVPRPDLVRLL